MLTSRLPLLALLACLAAMFVAGPAQAQTTTTPLTKTIAVTGKAANGKAFKGKFAISNFKAVGGRTYAVGTLTGTVKNRKVTRIVSIPAKLTGEAPAPAGTTLPATGARTAQLPPQQPGSCRVLNLVLGPLDLNLLGLRVELNQVNLRITAVPSTLPGGGLLGDLLCGITNLLNPSSLLGNQLSQILNAILALVPTTPAAR
jgi:hypothetical protein